jgi:hypothetical protein
VKPGPIVVLPTPEQARNWSLAACQLGEPSLSAFLALCGDLMVRNLRAAGRENPGRLAEHVRAKRLIGELITAAKAACPYVPAHVAAPTGGLVPVGRNLSRAVANVQAFLAVTGEEYE